MRFTEANKFPSSARIDEASGVIRGVKIIGTKSRNGRTYPGDVLAKAAPLYEGASVNFNHPRSPNDPRAAEDRFGRLRGVRYVESEQGLFGDLHYLRSHPMAGRVEESVKRDMPDLFGLSHNADGEGRRTSDGFLVESITKVISVDVVTDPATTRSFFESRQLQKISLSELVGTMPDDSKQKQYMQKMMKQPGGMDPETEVDPMDPETEVPSPEEAVKDAFRAEVVKAFDDEALDYDAQVGRIRDILKAHDEVKQTMSTTTNTATSGDPAAKNTGTPPANAPAAKAGEGATQQMQTNEQTNANANTAPSFQSLQEEIRALRAKDECRELLEETGHKSTPRLLKVLMAMPTNDERKSFLEEIGTTFVESTGTPPAHKPKPRTTGVKDSKADEMPRGKKLIEQHMMDEQLLELTNN